MTPPIKYSLDAPKTTLKKSMPTTSIRAFGGKTYMDMAIGVLHLESQPNRSIIFEG